MSLETNIDEIRQKVSGLDYAADAYLNYANSVTGASDTNVGDAIMSLAAGYGQGGGGIDKHLIAELNATWNNNTVADIARVTVDSLDFDTLICEHFRGGVYAGQQILSLIPNSDKSYSMGYIDPAGFVTGAYGKLTATNPTTDNPEIIFGWIKIGGGYYHPNTIKIYTAKMLHIFAK